MTKFGIIIAIEEYSAASDFSKIEFAVNDANSIKKAFIDQLYIEEKNIIFLINKNSIKIDIETKIKEMFARISTSDECYFYYIGHGFNIKSQNYITCWDTENSNLEKTSLAISEILLTPLKNSACSKSFIFIDSSAEELKSKNKMEPAVGNLVEKEYSELVRASFAHSIFLSCYPGEKSFTSSQAKHGIWTLQILNAINGRDDAAIGSDNIISNASLGKFLSLKTPQFITKTMLINERQNPYAVIDSSQIIPLIAFESDEEENNKLEIKFDQYIISREQHIPFKNMESFNKTKHKVPKDYNNFALKMANELAKDEFLKKEIEILFENARRALRLKSSNTVKDPEGGSLHTEFFRYNIHVQQSDNDFTEITIKRELELRVPLQNFPIPIDEIFTEGFDTITFPIKGTLDIERLEDALYDLEDENRGHFEQKDDIFSFFPNNIKGIDKVEISKNTLKIRFTSSQTSIKEILDFTHKTLETMATTLKNLIS